MRVGPISIEVKPRLDFCNMENKFAPAFTEVKQ